MSQFISLIMDVLSIQISLGSFTTSLGSLLFFLILIRYAFYRFYDDLLSQHNRDERAGKLGFHSEAEMNSYDAYMAGGDHHKDGKYY